MVIEANRNLIVSGCGQREYQDDLEEVERFRAF